jgi:murein DD-endopeptidase MepM/ murein hydrolase activator NlpD
MPSFPQRYNDDFRGWPVSPQHQQHPVRGTFLDPRPDPDLGAIYHTGVDVAVRDDKPEAGAPAGRTHRVFAIEGGVVEEATKPGVRGNVRIGHFGYGHVDARVKKGDRIKAGQFIGWTTKGSWHVHLTEFHFPGDGRRLLLNPLRPGGKLKPFVDTAPPIIHDVRFYTPATPTWGRRVTGVA